MRAAISLGIALVLASPGSLAQTIFIGEDEDGTITFTDRANDAAGFAVFIEASRALHHDPELMRRNLNRYDAQILEAANSAGISAALLKAVVLVESGFNPNAVSPAGAQGLCQLMPATARALGVSDSFDVEQNLDGGARLLRELLDRFDNTRHALAAYNAGPGRVLSARGVPNIAETRNFVERVERFHRIFRVERPVVVR
jgi:soluble lytic murein transglycosylase-like protein